MIRFHEKKQVRKPKAECDPYFTCAAHIYTLTGYVCEGSIWRGLSKAGRVGGNVRVGVI